MSGENKGQTSASRELVWGGFHDSLWSHPVVLNSDVNHMWSHMSQLNCYH